MAENLIAKAAQDRASQAQGLREGRMARPLSPSRAVLVGAYWRGIIELADRLAKSDVILANDQSPGEPMIEQRKMKRLN